MTDRKDAEKDIASLYGTDTARGRALIIGLIDDMGLRALTDEAVIRLANLHRREEDSGAALPQRDGRRT